MKTKWKISKDYRGLALYLETGAQRLSFASVCEGGKSYKLLAEGGVDGGTLEGVSPFFSWFLWKSSEVREWVG